MDYQKIHPGAFRVKTFVDWVVTQGVPLPKVDPKLILERRVKRALREIRINDPKGRRVRGMLPARLPVTDEKGNLILDVVYDHIHKMSLDHAILSFDQRDNKRSLGTATCKVSWTSTKTRRVIGRNSNYYSQTMMSPVSKLSRRLSRTSQSHQENQNDVSAARRD